MPGQQEEQGMVAVRSLSSTPSWPKSFLWFPQHFLLTLNDAIAPTQGDLPPKAINRDPEPRTPQGALALEQEFLNRVHRTVTKEDFPQHSPRNIHKPKASLTLCCREISDFVLPRCSSFSFHHENYLSMRLINTPTSTLGKGAVCHIWNTAY